MPLPRWITALLVLVAVALVPWILWLTFSLPSKHVSRNYDVAWVGFDIALAAMIAATAYLGWRRSPLLRVVAGATAAMLVCDAWFDIVTATPGERHEAVLRAVIAELPVAALCAFLALRRR